MHGINCISGKRVKAPVMVDLNMISSVHTLIVSDVYGELSLRRNIV